MTQPSPLRVVPPPPRTDPDASVIFVRGVVTDVIATPWVGRPEAARITIDDSHVVHFGQTLAGVVRSLIYRGRRVRVWAIPDGAGGLVAVTLRLTGRPGEIYRA